MLVGHILTHAAQRWPNRPALVDEDGRSFTYAEWNARVNRLANALARLGIGRGDRVAFYLRNVEALASAHLATQKLGAVSVPLNFRLREGEIPIIVEDSETRILLFERQFITRIERARPELGRIERFICIGRGDRVDALDYETLLQDAPVDEPHASKHQSLAMTYFAFDVLEGRFGDLNTHRSDLHGADRASLNDLQAERELSHVRVYNPRIFLPTHHDGSYNELWRSTEPIFQSIKESVTFARS